MTPASVNDLIDLFEAVLDGLSENKFSKSAFADVDELPGCGIALGDGSDGVKFLMEDFEEPEQKKKLWARAATEILVEFPSIKLDMSLTMVTDTVKQFDRESVLRLKQLLL